MGSSFSGSVNYQPIFKVTNPFAGTTTWFTMLLSAISSILQRCTDCGLPAGQESLTVSSWSETERILTMVVLPSVADLRIEMVMAGGPSTAMSGLEMALLLAARATRGCACSNPKRLVYCRIVSAVGQDAVTKGNRSVLREREVGKPVVVHHPGVNGGTLFELAEPGLSLAGPVTVLVGRHGAAFDQRGIQRAPSDALLVVGDIYPPLYGEPVSVGGRNQVVFHPNYPPRNVNPGSGLRQIEGEAKVYAVFRDER